MYEYQNRGMVERYYDKNIIDKVNSIRGEKYLKYRQMWDDPAQKINTYGAPLEILIELTSWCNYTCKMCRKNFVDNTERVNMSLDLVQRIADDAQKMDVASFWIGAGSECLIHPQIREALDVLLSVPTLDSTLLTNGSCLNKDIAKILIDKQVKNISVSLDAARRNTYKHIRGGDLEHVENNIEYLLKLKGNKYFPILRVSMVKMEENLDQRDEFLHKWEGRAAIIDYQTLVEYDNQKHQNVNMENVVCNCMDPFKRLYVNYDGSIYPCCVSGFQEGHYLGNIEDITLLDAWNSDKMRMLRNELRTGQLSENCMKCCLSRHSI